MPNAMDYDALAKMYASEQDPRQLTMNDALQNYSRQQKIEALIEEARSQQQWSNQQEELKNAAYIKQSNALADNYVRDKTNQWQADQAKQQAYTRDVIPRIAAYHAIGAYDKLLDDPSISDDFKNTLRNVPPEKRDAFLSAQLGFSPRDKTVAGLQNTDKKTASAEKIATDRNLSNEKIARIRAQKSAGSAKANKVPPTESAQANYLYNLGMEAELAGDSAKAVNLYNRADAAYKQAEAKAAAAAKVAMGGKPDVGALAEGTLRKNVVPTQETPAGAAIRSIQGKIGGGPVTNKPRAGDF